MKATTSIKMQNFQAVGSKNDKPGIFAGYNVARYPVTLAIQANNITLERYTNNYLLPFDSKEKAHGGKN